jgi:hypothetical protein
VRSRLPAQRPLASTGGVFTSVSSGFEAAPEIGGFSVFWARDAADNDTTKQAEPVTTLSAPQPARTAPNDLPESGLYSRRECGACAKPFRSISPGGKGKYPRQGKSSGGEEPEGQERKPKRE